MKIRTTGVLILHKSLPAKDLRLFHPQITGVSLLKLRWTNIDVSPIHHTLYVSINKLVTTLRLRALLTHLCHQNPNHTQLT